MEGMGLGVGVGLQYSPHTFLSDAGRAWCSECHHCMRAWPTAASFIFPIAEVHSPC